MITESYTIEAAVIELTYVDDTTEDFTLEAPNGGFSFGAQQLVIRPDYRDKNKVLRKGVFRYHLFWEYEYEAHEMDLQKLLIAKKITLEAPPNYYGGSANYQSYEVRCMNQQAIKDWLVGFPVATDVEDVSPSSSVTLRFRTITPLSWQDYLDVPWRQDEVQLEPDAPLNFTTEVTETSQIGTNSLFFDGINEDDYVDFGDVLDLGTSDRTIVMFYKLDLSATWRDNAVHIISKVDANPSPFRWSLKFRRSDTSIGFNWTDENNNGPTAFYDASSVWDNQWHKLVWRIDRDGDITIHVDDTLIAAVDVSGDDGQDFQTTFPLRLGSYTDTDGTPRQYFPGHITEVSMWNKVLTEQEYSEITTLNGDEDNLIGYWNMSEGSGTTLIDQSQNTNNGTINGATYTDDVPVSGSAGVNCDWDAVAGVDGYNLYLNKDGAGYVKHNSSLITSTQITLTGLDDGNYQAYVTAVSGGLESDPSDVQSFAITSENDAIADAGGWSGSGVFSHEGDYIQYNAPNSTATRRFIYSGEPDLTDIEVHVEVFEQGDADNNDPSWGINIGQTLDVLYGYGLGSNGDRIHFWIDGSSDGTINTGLNAGTNEVVSLKVKFENGVVSYKAWLRDSQSEPAYTEYGPVNDVEAGKFGLSSNYGFADWRCVRYEYTVL